MLAYVEQLIPARYQEGFFGGVTNAFFGWASLNKKEYIHNKLSVKVYLKLQSIDSCRIGPTQGCQIFLGTTYQNEKRDQIFLMRNIATSSIANHTKINPNWDFCFENLPSGNPGPTED
jgi:hypothetical protein